jgi:hypothetical protein
MMGLIGVRMVARDPGGWSAYVDAVVGIEAPGGVAWVRPAPVTRTEGTYPDREGRVICVITAHNPGGQTVSAEQNGREQERLERELTRRGWTWWQAAGGDPSWEHVEASAAVVGVAESEVAALGAEFGQDAIFVLTPAGRRIVGCLSAREISTGWSVSAEQPGEPAAGTDDEDEDLGDDDTGQEEEEDDDEGVREYVAIYEENLLAGERAAGFADEDEYLDWICRREGLLCVIRSPAGTIELHGDGHGGVLVRGAWAGPEGPFPVADTLRRLADAGVFEDSADFGSAAWDAGDIATVVLAHAGCGHWRIDGQEWTGGRIPYPRSPQDGGSQVLAIEHWEFTNENGGPIFPGRTSGWSALARIGPHYAVIGFFDGETECTKIDARTDQAAVAAFIDSYTALQSTRDRFRPTGPGPAGDQPAGIRAPGHP